MEANPNLVVKCFYLVLNVCRDLIFQHFAIFALLEKGFESSGCDSLDTSSYLAWLGLSYQMNVSAMPSYLLLPPILQYTDLPLSA